MDFFRDMARASILSGLGGIWTNQVKANAKIAQQQKEIEQLKQSAMDRERAEERAREEAKVAARKKELDDALLGKFDCDDVVGAYDDYDDDDFSDDKPASCEVSGLASARNLSNYMRHAKHDETAESAHRISDYMKENGRDPVMDPLTCLECIYWHGSKPETTRGHGCTLWAKVQVEYGLGIPDAQPKKDRITCDYFAPGVGYITTCYDCVHWNHERTDENDARSHFCRARRRRDEDEAAFRGKVQQMFGPSVDFTVLHSDYPWQDEDVCFIFELDRSLEPGFGQRVCDHIAAEQAAAKAGPDREPATAQRNTIGDPGLLPNTYEVNERTLDIIDGPDDQVLDRLKNEI